MFLIERSGIMTVFAHLDSLFLMREVCVICFSSARCKIGDVAFELIYLSFSFPDCQFLYPLFECVVFFVKNNASVSCSLFFFSDFRGDLFK